MLPRRRPRAVRARRRCGADLRLHPPRRSRRNPNHRPFPRRSPRSIGAGEPASAASAVVAPAVRHRASRFRLSATLRTVALRRPPHRRLRLRPRHLHQHPVAVCASASASNHPLPADRRARRLSCFSVVARPQLRHRHHLRQLAAIRVWHSASSPGSGSSASARLSSTSSICSAAACACPPSAGALPTGTS